MASVSIITVTQLKRKETLKLCAEHVKNQTYKRIVQWVIVEGSPSPEEAFENAKHVDALREAFHAQMPHVALEYITDTQVRSLRLPFRE